MKSPEKMKIYTFITIFILSSCSHLNKKDCYQYKKQQMSGVIKKVPDPDKKSSSFWILKTKPFCTAIAKNEELFQAYKKETEIHLVISDYNLYRRFVGKKVVVTGDLYSIHTGYHKRNVLISVEDIKELK